MTYLQAAVAVLAYTDRPLTVGELTAVALAEGLIRPRGRTPDRSMSSILYRRMVSDANAPISSDGGRFWLRGRALPTETLVSSRSGIRQVRRHAPAARRGSPVPGNRRLSPLPAPPFALPVSPGGAPVLQQSGGRYERAIERLAAALRRHRVRLDRFEQQMREWDADLTRMRALAPLLTLLGYRRIDQHPASGAGRRRAVVLKAGPVPALLVECFRLSHGLADAEAWSTIERARAAGLGWAMLTNGLEIRLYSVDLAAVARDPAMSLVLRIDLEEWHDDQTCLDTARLLFLLTRDAVRDGSAEAYLTARAVGSTLLSALDDPDSPLLRVLQEEVRARTGLYVPAASLARQARLAVRDVRGRDGAPSPADSVSVALAHSPARLITDRVPAGNLDLTG